MAGSIEGADEVLKDVEKYTEEQIKEMGKVVRKYATKTKKDAVSFAPHHRGNLKKNINVRGYKKEHGQPMHRVVGPRQRRTAAPFLVDGTKERRSEYYFGRKLLFGATISLGQIAPHRFMQKAREVNQDEFEREIEKIVKRDVDI